MRERISIEYLLNAKLPIWAWIDILEKLKQEYGHDAILECEAGSNSVTFMVIETIKEITEL